MEVKHQNNSILLIEDNIDHVDLIKHALRNIETCQLDTSSTLEQAKNLMDKTQYSLIIADIKLPDGDSIEFFKENSLFDINYVIIMTSFGDEHKAVSALKSGAKDYLVKGNPFFENIRNIIDRAFREINSLKEKARFELELKKSEKKYRTLFESSSDGIFIIEDFVFTDCNEKTLELFGFEHKSDFIGKKPSDVSPNEQYNEENSIKLSEKIIKEAEKENRVKRFYWKHKKIDGTTFDAEISLNPFILEGKTHFHGIIKDITKRLKAEEQLRIWESIFRHAHWGILLTESSGEFINMLNPAFAILLGYTEAELHYSTIKRLFPDNNKAIAKILIENTRKNNYYTTETILLKKNGHIFPVIINSFVIRNTKNQPMYFVLNIQDITERKHTEKLKQEVEVARRSSKLKQQFLANMSHEIRTPLNSILGFIELLKDTSLDSTQSEYLSMVDESSSILLNLINDILDFSKIEAGKLTLNPQSINISKTFSKVFSIFELPAKSKGIDFRILNLLPEPIFVKVDEIRLLQIVSNLVSNAIKFTKKGSINISVELLKTLAAKAYFRVEVADTGVGISNENLQKLFRVFSQLDMSHEKNIQGTGLGLAISKQLVELMGGDIGVESEPEKGSSFWFTFAAERCEGLAESLTKETAIDYKNLNLNLRILLAEDKLLNQKLASVMISNAGCIVDIANNGLEVLEKFEPDKYDLIFMDIQMPVMDGMTAVKKLREKYPKLPPIIGLSASAMEGDAEKFKKEGLNDYLSKPVQAESIYSKLILWGKNND